MKELKKNYEERREKKYIENFLNIHIYIYIRIHIHPF